MTFAFPLLLAGLAFGSAPVPIELPAGEPVEDWAEALTIAGLVAAHHGSGAWVEVRVGGDGWLLVAHDAGGGTRSVSVPWPRTSAEREDVALLAASLARPLTSALAVPPAPVPAPVKAVPNPSRPAEPPVEPPPPAPPPVEPPLAVTVPPATNAPAFAWELGLDLGVALRVDRELGPRAAIDVRAGIPGVMGGLRVAVEPEAAVPDFAPAVRVGVVELGVSAQWRPGLGLVLGDDLGVQWLWVVDDSPEPLSGLLPGPGAGLSAGWRFPLGAHAWVEPGLRAGWNGGNVVLDAVGGARRRLSPWTLDVGVRGGWGR